MQSTIRFADRVRNALKRFGGASGASGAVEFALIAPVLFVLLIGTLQAGLMLGIAHSLEQITADAGRYAVVGIGAEERQTLAERWVAQEAGHYPLLVAQRMSAATREAAGTLIVTASYDASYLPKLPVIGAIIDFPATIQRSATMMIP